MTALRDRAILTLFTPRSPPRRLFCPRPPDGIEQAQAEVALES
jgi:hypothetical protein